MRPGETFAGSIRRFAVAAFMAAALLPAPAGAQQESATPEAEDQLAQISRQVESEGARLLELQGAQKKLQAEFDELRKSIASHEASIASNKAKQAELQRERETTAREMDQGQARLAEVSALMRVRMRALAMQPADRVFERLLLNPRRESFERTMYLFMKVRGFDERLMQEVGRLMVEKSEQKQRLERLIDEQQQTRDALTKESQALSVKAKKLEEVKKKIAADRKASEETLAELRAQALRLETVVAGLTGGRSIDAAEIHRGKRGRPIEERDQEQAPFKGPGLAVGEIALPVEGSIVQGYGLASKRDGFSGLLKSRGIDFKTDTGAAIHAIERAKVIFRGPMPGYGEIVILDHGDREYSLYGRLGESSVRVGQLVEKGEVIAETGEGDDQGRNFYFEIRKNGTPVNPGSFHKKLS